MPEVSSKTKHRIAVVAITAILIILTRLLVAETELPNQELLKDVLWVLGAIIITFVGGAAAIDALKGRR